MIMPITRIEAKNFLNENEYNLFDDEEICRLNIYNAIIRYIFKSEFSAPVTEILENGRTYVLDVGCGSGSWLFDMAIKYPNSSFIGIDYSPNVPENSKLLNNIAFLRGDLNNGLPFPDNSFDLVHMADMRSSIERDQWPLVIRELTRVLKPGGWLEVGISLLFSEDPLDLYLYIDDPYEVSESFALCIESTGCDPNIYNKIPEFLKATKSYEKVMCAERSIPSGTWADGLGILVSNMKLLHLDAK
ncbi:17941_t:CDS:2 [Acaulospora morrowiae]|uniref:17941_t:CDS:1 n=1 Tax=Acaulospora morrowiae TaxID=94023 RepID=A0A9N9BG34_9GLOM|nr:17941_t:CDS:2 [Acaulospora morrowiae]